MRGRFATGLVIFALLQPFSAHATTAPSLSARIVIDGVLDEYASDEIVLDETSSLPERAGDSAWGSGNDITRVALTWDYDFLYLAVEGRSFDSFLSMMVSNRAGGLRSLEDAGTFRRAIELPRLPINLIALATPERFPDVARADDAHPFGLVDRDALRRAVSGVHGGVVGFEMAVPWSMLALSQPIRLVAAVTGEVGTGAGDSAPDASAEADNDRFARAVLDRRVLIAADADHDRIPDSGISPRTAATIEGGTVGASSRDDADLDVVVSNGTIAPDFGMDAIFEFRTNATEPVFLSTAVYSLEGDRVRTLSTDEERVPQGGSLSSSPNDSWDGRDDTGAVVRGGGYILVVEWGFARGERSHRSKGAVAVVR